MEQNNRQKLQKTLKKLVKCTTNLKVLMDELMAKENREFIENLQETEYQYCKFDVYQNDKWSDIAKYISNEDDEWYFVASEFWKELPLTFQSALKSRVFKKGK